MRDYHYHTCKQSAAKPSATLIMNYQLYSMMNKQELIIKTNMHVWSMLDGQRFSGPHLVSIYTLLEILVGVLKNNNVTFITISIIIPHLPLQPYRKPFTKTVMVFKSFSIFENLRQWSTMMTSSNKNIFRVTGPLCGEFTGHRWRRALMFALICARTNDEVNNRDAGDLRRRRAHCDVIIMDGFLSMPWVKNWFRYSVKKDDHHTT